jgi:hypothetical protein
MELSNKHLAFVVFFTIVLSLVSTLVTLNRISSLSQRPLEIVAKATSDYADVQLTVTSTVSILLLNDTINFGSGWVNDSNTEFCGTNASLIAGATYNDTGDHDCWTADPIEAYMPTSLHLENDGNNNVTVKVYGPANNTFFGEYSGGLVYGIDFKARNYESGSCPATATLQDSWLHFGATNQTICDDMQYGPATDEIAIDVRVIIPRNLPQGTYQNNTIEFTAETS